MSQDVKSPTAPQADSQVGIAVVGSLNYDIVVPVAKHPLPGETVLGGDHYKNPGGKGANQAVAAARLGQRVAMIGRLGDDAFGELLLKALQDDHVDVTRVQRTTDSPSGIALIAVDEGGENNIIVSPGANAKVSAADVTAAKDTLASAAVTLLQLEIPLEAVITAAELAQGIVILNPAPARTLPEALLRNVDVLVPNRSELATMCNAPVPTSRAEVVRLARTIKGPCTIVVTLGAEGALIVTQDDTVHVSAIRVEAVDTTAAGDCFCGALADALARGEVLEKAVAWAVRAAAIAVTRRGAQASLPRRDEIEALTSY